HLDGNYTVFGEVISGMKVVEKMQFVPTNQEDRPLKNIRIKSMSILSD
ncbi:MAG: peptidylprolyl isomerase, partial [Tannerellaceae bacterium]|nr:peptidylprolyl isomerase [Tannerellaceae bacterium]